MTESTAGKHATSQAVLNHSGRKASSNVTSKQRITKCRHTGSFDALNPIANTHIRHTSSARTILLII